MKHILSSLILLIGISTIVSGQTDKTSKTQKYLLDSSSIELNSVNTLDNILYFRTGLGYNLITLKDELISPDVYTGSGFYIPLAIKDESKYWKVGMHWNMHLGWLRPTLAESTDAPQLVEELRYGKRYFHHHFLLYMQRRIKESGHSLGGSTQIFATRVNSLKQRASPDLQSFFKDTRSRDKGLSVDISYTYAAKLFKRPLNINLDFPIVHLQKTSARKKWTFGGPSNVLRPNVNIDLAINTLHNEFNYTTWRLFYDWKMTYNDRNGGTYYQQLSGINTIGILVDFNVETY